MQGIRSLAHPPGLLTTTRAFSLGSGGASGRSAAWPPSSTYQQEGASRVDGDTDELDDSVDDANIDILENDDEDADTEPRQEQRQAPTTTPHQAATKDLRERYLELLPLLLKRDPLLQLNEYYQKHGIQSLKTQFEFNSRQPKQGAIVWRCTFSCPLIQATYPSALNLWDAQLPAPKDETIQALQSVMGACYTVDGVVYLASKKAAKKMCAMNFLLEMSLAKEQASAIVTTAKTSQENTITAPVASLEASIPRNKPRKFPAWVETLYKAGVRTVDISYRETSAPAEWKGQPTLVSCTMTIAKPCVLTVSGEPSSSRREMRDSAVDLLAERIRQELGDKRPVPPTLKNESPSPDEEDAFDIKKHLIQCSPSVIAFYQPAPHWACAPFSQSPCWYLYELVLRTASGAPLVQDRMKLEPSVVTRVGIMFPCDPEVYRGTINDVPSSVIQATFGIHSAKDNKPEAVTVELRNRTVFDPLVASGTTTTTMERLDKLKRFNGVLNDWKTYGMNVPKRDLGCESDHGSNAIDRTSLFVPLCQQLKPQSKSSKYLFVDWELIEDELQSIHKPFLVSAYRTCQLPVVGEMDTRLLCSVFILLGVTSLTPMLTNLLLRTHLGWKIDPVDLVASVVCFSLALFTGLALVVPPARVLSWNALRNRFLLHRDIVYVLGDHQDTTMTAYSAMLLKDVPPESLQKHRQRYHLDLRRTSFSNYFLKKYGLELRYPKETLLEAATVDKHTSHDSLKGTNVKEEASMAVHLVPELVSALAIPRDLVYTVGLASTFMPELERAVCVSRHAATLIGLSADSYPSRRGGRVAVPASPPVPVRNHARKRHLLLSDTLGRATALFPTNEYEGLEFLGDAVLGYFLALQTVSQNSSLTMDSDDIGDVIAAGGKNHALVSPALIAGLPRMVRAGKHTWRSSYSVAASVRRNEISMEEGSKRFGEIVDIATSTLSDVVESTLAATYLSDTLVDESGEDYAAIAPLDPFSSTCIALLQKLSLLPAQPGSCLQRSNLCFRNGYRFDLDQQWSKRLGSVDAALQNDEEAFITLVKGLAYVTEKFASRADADKGTRIRNLLSASRAKTLMLCALFDDSLDEASMYNPNAGGGREFESDQGPTTATTDNFLHVALVRDSLYHTGAYGLQLLLTRAVFERNPRASPGDLHLLRACAITDDVLVYVMVKAGLHKALFDQESASSSELESRITMADIEGRSLRKNKWVLGLDEFRRRHAGTRDNPDITPAYPGLFGGRFCGMNQKLPTDLTKDLMFSFKAIVGALILSLGLDRTWTCIGPLFEELLLLTADELRSQPASASGLASYYQSGGAKRKKKKAAAPKPSTFAM